MEFSSNAIKKLGKRLRDGSQDPADITMLEDYRSTFDPLLVEMSLLLDKVLRNAGVPLLLSGRSKRTKSIIRKLQRSENRGMDLSRVSDLVGLRIVVADVDSQNAVLEAITSSFEVKDVDDYRETPSDSGYRCVHIIIQKGKKLLEIQLRTMPQHLWAIESEVFGEQVKEGGGDAKVRAYLRVLSEMCEALDRGQEITEKNHEAPFLTERLPVSNILHRLQKRFNEATFVEEVSDEEASYLIVFDTERGEKLHEYRFGQEERAQAIRDYQLMSRTIDASRFDVLILNTSIHAGLPVTHPQFFL